MASGSETPEFIPRAETSNDQGGGETSQVAAMKVYAEPPAEDAAKAAAGPGAPAPSPAASPAAPTDPAPLHRSARHRLYCTLFGIEPHLAIRTRKSPTPTEMPERGERIQVLLALHSRAWESIHQWENRIFQAFLVSEGGLLTAFAYFYDHKNLHGSWAVGYAVIAFGIVTFAYILLAIRAHGGNGALLTKIEAALGLCEPDLYVEDGPFFGYTGYWVEDWRTPILLLIHCCVVIVTACAVIFGFP